MAGLCAARRPRRALIKARANLHFCIFVASGGHCFMLRPKYIPLGRFAFGNAKRPEGRAARGRPGNVWQGGHRPRAAPAMGSGQSNVLSVRASRLKFVG